MKVTEQGSRRRAAWLFMAFAFASLVMPRNRGSRHGLSIQVEDAKEEGLGETPAVVDNRASIQSPAMYTEMRDTLLRDDFGREKIEVNALEIEKDAIEQELAVAKDALTSLQEEKTRLENKLGEVLSTSNAQKEELEAMTRNLRLLKREFLEETRNTSPEEQNSEDPRSWKKEDFQQTLGQKLRNFLRHTSGYWKLHTGDFRLDESSMSTSYSKSIGDMLRWLNTTASSVGESHRWLEISSQIVVANCDFLLLLVEMLIALLFVDVVLSSFINWSQERIDGNGRKASSPQTIC
ncbi:unnamed protein product [Cylindrotheca closterium]|uniref:Uncharacterized protein n=1 Tax=Cylindrotheca closterium TaxID=2856 RepID=A0AAD2CLD7_9STRA|nr:unnamed protein product [Cylindrotheca closterium]